jgi:hypothetical protein
MFTRSFLIAALALAGAEAFAPGPAMIRPAGTARAGVSTRPLRMQSQEDTEIAEAKAKMTDMTGKGMDAKGPQSVASGGTRLTTKGDIAPLFILPSSSVIGDGKMVGDKGFDPLGFATSIEKLRIYKEAELKHGRLAMLAALGWPVAEELNGPISKALGLQSTLIPSPISVIGGDNIAGEFLSRNPSILNGGLGAISPAYWIGVLAFGAATELYATKIQRRAGFRNTLAALGVEDLTGVDIDGDGQVGEPKMLAADNYLPGDLGFDPLGLYKGNDKHKTDLQLKEVNNGRLAMIAITGYAFNEAATKLSVVTSMGLPKLS